MSVVVPLAYAKAVIPLSRHIGKGRLAKGAGESGDPGYLEKSTTPSREGKGDVLCTDYGGC